MKLERGLAAGEITLRVRTIALAVEARLSKASCERPRGTSTPGRSRNDQVATLFRMRVMRLSTRAISDVQTLGRAIVSQARCLKGSRRGTSHLQPA